MIKRKGVFFLFFFIFFFKNAASYVIYKNEIIKSFFISEQYDDNIYLLKQKESDWITVISVGTTFILSSNRYSLSLSYSPTWTIYKDHPKSDTLRHSAKLDTKYGIKKHLWFYLSDLYEKSEEPIEEIGAWKSQTVRKNRNTYKRNLFDTKILWQFKKRSSVSIGFKCETLRNEDPNYDNSTEYGPYFHISYRANIKNKIEFYYYSKKNRTSREIGEPAVPSFNGYDASVRYTYYFKKNTSVFFQYKNVKRNFLRPGYNTVTVDDYSIGIYKPFSPKLSISCALFYFKPHGFKNNKGHKGYFIDIIKRSHNAQWNVRYKKSWDEGYLESQRREFTRYNKLSITYKKLLDRNYTFNMGFYYRKNIYQTGDENNTYEINASLNRMINRWSQFTISYSHLERSSTIPLDEFIDNRVTFSFQIIKR